MLTMGRMRPAGRMFDMPALELIRQDISSNAGASLANALLLDLKAMDLIPNSILRNIILDKCKLDRAKDKIKITAQQKHEESVGNLICIGVDGRMDKDTLFHKEIVKENGEKSMKKTKGPERHLTFTNETPCESKYLTHRILPNTGATGAVHAEKVVDVLKQFNSENSIKAILVDNTNSNTGCEGGMVAVLEKKLKRNIHTIGCSLHHNELPFRAVFKNLDGCAKGPTTFSGPLGKLCSNDFNDLPQIPFSTISNPLDSIVKIDEITDLSCDQRLLYEYTVGISRGKVNSKYASWKIGPLNQARWLTLAIRLMSLWTRGAYPQQLKPKLYNLLNFIVNVYAPCWFEIKKNYKLCYQPLHIFHMIQRIKKQPNEIRQIAFRNMQGNTFCLLPENFLYCMVKSEEVDVREEALKKILAIRSEEPQFKRQKRIPNINFNATHWTELINLKLSGIFEPPMTEGFSNSEIQQSLLNGTKLDLPDLPSHSQGVERAVKLITEASQSVYGFEARHRHITAKLMSYELRPAFSSKGSYTENFDSLL